MSMLHVLTACLCSMSLPHVHAACPCCISMLHVRASWLLYPACPRWKSMLHVHAACQCCMSMVMSLLHACSCCMFLLHVHAASPYCMAILHVHTACPCRKSFMHVLAACPRCMSTLHCIRQNFAEIKLYFVISFRQNFVLGDLTIRFKLFRFVSSSHLTKFWRKKYFVISLFRFGEIFHFGGTLLLASLHRGEGVFLEAEIHYKKSFYSLTMHNIYVF
jgi:hypothetical protein